MVKHRISNLTQKLRVAAAILMVSSLGLFYPGTVSNLRAQSPTKATPSSSTGGPKEGIKVHGHWTIDIRNPDGKLVSHHEFENALMQTGGLFLGNFLRRTHKPGEWAIELGSPNNVHSSPCKTDLGGPRLCGIYEPTTQHHFANAIWIFKSLTITSTIRANIHRTVLAGTATARSNGSIDSVATLLVGDCPVDTQGVCSSVNFDRFTSTQLAVPISVVAGQIIQVEVEISFL